jgi:CheY-like chemotaxis protein
LKLKPTSRFAGSSIVPEELGFFASSSGERRVLIAHPRSDHAGQMAGLLSDLGFKADVATNSRQAFELATASPDYEMIFIHMAIKGPPVDQLIGQLRKERRTAMLPIGLIALPDDLAGAQRLAESGNLADDLAQQRVADQPIQRRRSLPLAAFVRPPDPEAMKSQIDTLLHRAGRHWVSPQERQQQAAAAIDWMVALSDRPQTLFDLRRQLPSALRAVYAPQLSIKAIVVLGRLGTVQGQRALLDVAGGAAQPLAARQAAATAFARSAEQYGVLLTSREILRQYDIYNASESADRSTQDVLSSILDVIEEVGHQKR